MILKLIMNVWTYHLGKGVLGMKETNKVFKILVASICCCYLFSVSMYPVKVFADETAFNSNTKSHRKSEILKTYPPNLSEMQEIGFGAFKTESGEVVEPRVRPDAHFRADNGKEYFIFYENHLDILRDTLYKTLQNLYEEYYTTFLLGRNFLNNEANDGGFFTTLISLPGMWVTDNIANLDFLLGLFGLSNGVASARDKARLLMERSKELIKECESRELLRKSGIPTKGILTFVQKDLKNPFVNIFAPSDYNQIEKNFNDIMLAGSNDKNTIAQINSALDKYYEEMTPRASVGHAVDFTFPLSRASYYLSNFEKDLQSKDEETLSAMFELRKKINRLTLEHRFIFEQNKAPILGITIDRCKIILEDEQRTMIFLDQQETKKFIQKIEKMLDSKASIISGQYSFEGFTGPQLRELAESLKPESFQDMIDEMEKDIRTAEKECDKIKAASMFSAARAVKQFAVRDDIIQFASNLLTDSGVSTQSGQIQKFNENDVKEYLSAQNSSKLSGMESPLALAVNDLNLTPVEKSSLIKSFEQFLEYRDMQANLEIKKSKKDYLDEVKKDQDDFLNLFKLYIRLVRGDYNTRNDFWGIVVEEVKKCCETVNKRLRTLREYFIQEIQRLD